MNVSRSRHFGVALAAATLIATGAAVVGPGGAANATTVPAGFYGPLDASAPPRAEAPPAAQAAPAAVEAAPAEPAAEAAPAPQPPAPAPLAVTPEDLARIVPGMPAEKIAAYIAPLNAAMARGGIDNPVRQAAFIAQLAVESDSFRTFEEYASGRAYEGRADLGNTQAGDGERFKGRGAIQITGRHNYESVSQFTGVDFVANPELLEAPENAFNTAVWYWTSRNLNQVADSAGIVRVSEVVNGGHHALARRVADFQRGLDVLLHP
ncbi:glycoside hydrolase family 19 protein [Rhodococcus daqingensis]|uniref:Glycoside hydrolase family 19 protein n=1 Tax=Rhodococcus daqingensis TaxID=2479363 RepID=A0ABW2RS59_9NOCA